MKPDVPKELTQRIIHSTIGNTQNNLAYYLKHTLLECVDHSYSIEFKFAKMYVINKSGYDFLVSKCYHSPDTKVEIIKDAAKIAHEKYIDEISALLDGTLEYKFTSDRFYTKLQNIKKPIRQKLLADATFQYQYDTECAAATLLYEHAKRLGCPAKMDAIFHYIHNKTQIRSELSIESQIELDTIKMIITSLFSGGILGKNDHFALYRNLPFDTRDSIVDSLNSIEFIKNLKSDISLMWKFLNSTDTYLLNTQSYLYLNHKNKKPRKARLSSKRKWGLYFKLEQHILLTTIAYTGSRDIKIFLEHDGFCTNKKLDQSDLISYIKKMTGFSIKLDYEFIPSDVTGIEIDNQPVVTTSIGLLPDFFKNTSKYKTRENYILIDKLIASSINPNYTSSVSDSMVDLYEAENSYETSKVIVGNTHTPLCVIFSDDQLKCGPKCSDLSIYNSNFDDDSCIPMRI
jgi:hypothetical protein